MADDTEEERKRKKREMQKFDQQMKLWLGSQAAYDLSSDDDSDDDAGDSSDGGTGDAAPTRDSHPRPEPIAEVVEKFRK